MKKTLFLIFLLFLIAIFSGFAQQTIFKDMFKDNSNKWSQQQDNDFFELIENGKFAIRTVNSLFARRTENEIQIDETLDFKINCRINKISGEESKFYGITYGCSIDNYYSFLINDLGLFVIVEFNNGQRVYLNPWTRSDKIKIQSPNVLSINKTNDSLKYSINGEVVSTLPFRSLFGSRFGFYCSPRVEMEVYEFEVLQEQKSNIKKTPLQTVNQQNNIVEIKENPERKGILTVEIKPVVVNKNATIEPEAVTLKPEFNLVLKKLPKDSAFFIHIDQKEIKSNRKENTFYQVLLGDINRMGWQMKEPNFKKALKYYENARESGDSVAFSRIAYFKYDEGAQEANPKEFIRLLKESANRNYPDAQYDLAIIYLNGLYNVPKNWDSTRFWLNKFIDKTKDSIALNQSMTCLGRIFYSQSADSFGVKPHLETALLWLRQANANKDINLINHNLSKFSQLRYLLQKKPGFIPEINVNIDYSSYEQVENLGTQVEKKKTLFTDENMVNYISALKENVLYSNFEKSKSDKKLLIKYIEDLEKKAWLRPENKPFIEYAYRQIPATLDYTKIDDIRFYYELLVNKKYQEDADKMRMMCVQTLYQHDKDDLNKTMELVETLIRQTWLRNEAKSYIPVIKETFENLVTKTKGAELQLKKELFFPKGEFETSADYAKRQSESAAYQNLIDEKYANVKDKFRIQLIRFSYEIIPLTITSIGTYNADKEVFPVTINGLTEDLKISLTEAVGFKSKINEINVTGEKQLLDNAIDYDVFNIKIINPVTGSAYPFGKQKEPLYIDYFPDDTGIGVPKLTATIKFIEPSGNNILDAKERGQLMITLSNSGTGVARMIEITLQTDSLTPINYDRYKKITGMEPGTEQVVYFELIAPKDITTGIIPLKVVFSEKKGFAPTPFTIAIPTQAFKEPKLVFIEAGIKENGNGDNIIENLEIIDVTALIQNKGQGKAIDARAVINCRDNNIVFIIPEQANQALGDIEGGESVKVKFSFIVNNSYTGSDLLPIDITLTESEGLYGGKFPLGLEMKKISIVATSIKVSGQYAQDKQIEDVSLTSDVDKNIPEIDSVKNQNRYALIIGNEDYTKYQKGLQTEANVDFARGDAITFAKYAEKVFGIPSENIFLYTDAIGSVMESGIEKLSKIAEYNESAEIIFYYAGHGLPEENTKESYIMPVDISGVNITGGIKLSDLYRKLTKGQAKRITIFLDACFSGGGRNQGLLAARAVKVKPKEESVTGNLVVFSGCSGEQISLPYKEKKHGIFTYFLLKKLQDSKGMVTYGELWEAIKKDVPLNAVIKNGKEQNPEVNFSRNVLDTWPEWKIK
jgi:hypothetical protein